MAALELALVLLATVLVSAVLDQLLPRISLPLIQIACGIVVALVAQERIDIDLNPEIFMVLFIAPLLFHEARDADKHLLWKNRRTMLSYAIALVVAIVLIVGFAVHAMIPSISLAAAFALGAALGPTDPIAVASISEQASIPKRQQTILQGESLLNDASGIVSFEFAVAAIVTGSFSAVEAVQEFVVSFFGALAIGIAFGFVLVKFADKVRDLGLDNTTFHVSLELLTPFVAYLLGEVIGVSGVILVVACGITMSLMPRSFDPSRARVGIVSSSVWQVLVFAFNGVVFVLLGTQLPQSFGDMWVDDGISNLHLLAYIFVITGLMHTTRFVWTLVSDAIVFKQLGESVGVLDRIRSAVVMTLAGSKGAITLAIMFSLPVFVSTGTAMVPLPKRDLLIFLASGVILLSLLLATFFVPLLAPRKEDPNTARAHDAEARAQILRNVIEELTARQTPENRKTIAPVIAQYNERLERFKGLKELEDESDFELRIKALEWEQEFILDEIDKDEIPPLEGYQCISRLARIESMLKHGKNRTLAIRNWIRRTALTVRKYAQKLLHRLPSDSDKFEQKSSRRIKREIQVRSSIYVCDRLRSEMAESPVQSEKISQLIAEYERTITMLRGPAPSITALTAKVEPELEVMKKALRIELEQIQLAYDEGRLSRAAAQRMRENVFLMQLDLDENV